MREFFKVRRRIFGVMTLMLALFCMCFQMRGETYSDTLYIECGAHTRVSMNSVHGYLLVNSETAFGDAARYSIWWQSLFCCDRDLLYLFYLDDSIGWRFQCFAVGVHAVTSDGKFPFDRWTLFVSCWSIVLPLTLLSAGLLLSKPRLPKRVDHA